MQSKEVRKLSLKDLKTFQNQTHELYQVIAVRLLTISKKGIIIEICVWVK